MMHVVRASEAQTFVPAGHDGVLNQVITGRELFGTDAVSIWRGIFDEGGAAELHVHETSIQIYVVVSGSFLVGDDAHAVRLEADDSVVIPAGQPHTIRAVDGAGSVLVISSPALR